jgi:hypothetical protein
LLTHDLQMDTGITNPASGPTAAALDFSPPLVNGPGPDLVVFEITRNTSEPPDPFQIEVDSKLGLLSSWGPQLSIVSFDAVSRNGGSPANISQLENDAFSYLSTFAESPLHGMAIDLDEFGVIPLGQVSSIQFGALGPESFDPVLFMGIRSAAAVAGDFSSDGLVQAIIPEPTSTGLFVIGLAALCAFGDSLPIVRRKRHVRSPEVGRSPIGPTNPTDSFRASGPAQRGTASAEH